MLNKRYKWVWISLLLYMRVVSVCVCVCGYLILFHSFHFFLSIYLFISVSFFLNNFSELSYRTEYWCNMQLSVSFFFPLLLGKVNLSFIIFFSVCSFVSICMLPSLPETETARLEKPINQMYCQTFVKSTLVYVCVCAFDFFSLVFYVNKYIWHGYGLLFQ